MCCKKVAKLPDSIAQPLAQRVITQVNIVAARLLVQPHQDITAAVHALPLDDTHLCVNGLHSV
jgi:hypothetical protein